MYLKKGEYLCLEGEACDTIYIVRSGLLDASSRSDIPNRRSRIFGPGSIIGEVSMLNGEPNEYTIKAIENSDLITITPSLLQATLAKQPSWIKSILTFLLHRHKIARENKRKNDYIQSFPSLLYLISQSVKRKHSDAISKSDLYKGMQAYSCIDHPEIDRLLNLLEEFDLLREQNQIVYVENAQIITLLYEALRHRAIYKTISPHILSLTDQAILTSFVNIAREEENINKNGTCAVGTQKLIDEVKKSMHGMSLTFRNIETLVQKRILTANGSIRNATLNDIPSFSADFDKILDLLELNKIFPQLDKKLII